MLRKLIFYLFDTFQAIILGAETKKPLFVGIRNKYCCVCRSASYQKTETPPHSCYMNYNGPSTGMEQDIIVEGFRQSVNQHGLIYKYYVGDGDSSVYARIVERVSYGRDVVKMECANHVCRNFHTHLRKLSADKKSFPLDVRKFLTQGRPSAIERLVKGVRSAIKECGRTGNLDLLKHDIRNAPYHVFGDHNKCRETFCKRKGSDEINLINQLEASGLLIEINRIVRMVLEKADRLASDTTTNHAERFMSLVSKFTGGKRINYTKKGSYYRRCLGAAASHSGGPGWHISPWKKLCGRSPGCIFKKKINSKATGHARRLLNFSKSEKTKKKKRFEATGPDADYGPDAAELDVSEDELMRRCQTIVQKLKEDVSSKEKADILQHDTCGQRTNIKWLEARKNRLTSSNFSLVIKRKLKTSPHNLIKKLLYTTSTINNRYIHFGLENEKRAIQIFEGLSGKVVKSCGLFVNTELPFLGASPDGLIDDNTIVEVKCVPSIGKLSLMEAAMDKKIKNFVFLLKMVNLN